MRSDYYIRANRRHWDALSSRIKSEAVERLRQVKEDPYFLEKWEPKIARYLGDIAGKKIIVPQFGDGLVMLACAKKGAIVTGVDFSDKQVHFAAEDAMYCGVKVDLVEADWQNLPKSIPENYFDLAVTECGIFIWIQNLEKWMRNAYKTLKIGGRLIVSDFHLISIIAESKDGKVTFRRSYFDQRPETCKPRGDVPLSIEFRWKLSDVINSAVEVGFRIARVEEFYVEEPDGIPFIPNNFLLVAAKI